MGSYGKTRIIINPKILAGKPVIAGTRIPVELVLKKLAQKMNLEEILRDFPRLTKADIRAVIFYAQDLVAREEIYPLKAA